MKYELKSNDHPKLTDDEKEFLGIIGELKNFYQHLNPAEEKHKEMVREKVKEMDYCEEGIRSFDGKRKEFQRLMDDTEKPRREEVHHIDCPRCKKYNYLKPYGEMKDEKGVRYFTYYCKKCKLEFSDFYPIESEDQLVWIDNFIEQSLLVRDDDTTYAEKFSMTTESIKIMKEDRKDVARHAREMKEWKAPHLKYVADCEAWVKAHIRKFREQLDEIELAGDDEYERLLIIDKTSVRRAFDDSYYTDDEREIIELYKYFEDHYKERIGKDETFDEMCKTLYEGTLGMRTSLENFAKDRFNFWEDVANDDKARLKKLYHVECTHCFHPNATRPMGEKLNEKGWRYYHFKCTKCGEEFMDAIPNKDEDALAYFEDFIQQANIVMEDGRTYKEHHGIADAVMLDFKEKAIAKKARLKTVKEALEGMQEIEDKQKEDIVEGIGFMTLQKISVESGNQPIGES